MKRPSPRLTGLLCPFGLVLMLGAPAAGAQPDQSIPPCPTLSPHAVLAKMRQLEQRYERLERDLAMTEGLLAMFGNAAESGLEGERLMATDVSLGVAYLQLDAIRIELDCWANKLEELMLRGDLDDESDRQVGELWERNSGLVENEGDVTTTMYDIAELIGGSMSRGQRQRAAIAHALLTDPQLIIMDEPTSALTEELEAEVRRLLRKLNDESHPTVLLVTHEPEYATSWRYLVDNYVPTEQIASGAATPSGLGDNTLGARPIPDDLLAQIRRAHGEDRSYSAEVDLFTTGHEPSRIRVNHQAGRGTRVVGEVDGRRGRERFEMILVGVLSYFRQRPEGPFLKIDRSQGMEGYMGKGSPLGTIEHRTYSPSAMIDKLEKFEHSYRGLEPCGASGEVPCHAVEFLDDGRKNIAYFGEKDYLLRQVKGADKNGERTISLDYEQMIRVDIPSGDESLELTGDPAKDMAIMQKVMMPN